MRRRKSVIRRMARTTVDAGILLSCIAAGLVVAVAVYTAPVWVPWEDDY